MIRALDVNCPPAGCVVDEFGNWIFETTADHVEAVADEHGRPVVELGGFLACVRMVSPEQALIVRAPLAVAS